MNIFFKGVVKIILFFTSKEKATKVIKNSQKEYLDIAYSLPEVLAMRKILVPMMEGVDDDMRGWSYYELIEHMVIATDQISKIIHGINKGVVYREVREFDIKVDVIPARGINEDCIPRFNRSIDNYFRVIEEAKDLKHGIKFCHPIFGNLDSKGWHAMMAFHMKAHLRQARYISKRVSNEHLD